MKRSQQVASILEPVAVGVVLLCAVLLVFLRQGVWQLILTMLLGMLYISMRKKWRQLCDERPAAAKISCVTHIVAMVLVLALLVMSFFLRQTAGA